MPTASESPAAGPSQAPGRAANDDGLPVANDTPGGSETVLPAVVAAADLNLLLRGDPAQAEKLRELLRRSLLAPSKLNDTRTPSTPSANPSPE